MGGCRCSYRNCTVRTDGSTHMFHYPVFDKLRCHQWLTNAQKHEFLNLKVSQLKNRVICQHHFKDEFFMNFKKDKLTFKAIPTLNGPFCDSGPYTDNAVSLDDGKLYPISLDDIETEYLSLSDKKATFSVKYGDFLTNSEVMDMDTIDISSINNKAQVFCKDAGKKCKDNEDPLAMNPIDIKNSTVMNILPNKTTIAIGDNQSQLIDLTPVGYILVQPPSGVGQNELQLNTNNPNENTQMSNNNSGTQVLKQNQSFSSHFKTEVPKEKKIKILSQKKISEPLSLTGKLEPVSPSLILRIPEKKNKAKYQENVTSSNEKDENQASHINILNNNSVNVIPSNEVTIAVDQKQINKKCVQANEKVFKNTLNIGLSSNKSLLKPKINQDRVVAIREKRKFNMKLRDIIESCLDKIDDQDNGQTISEINTKNEQVGTFLSKNTALPSVHEYTIACLEARMKRMEDVLLNKIDQNTQRIIELKNSIVSSDKKSTCTQTTNNEQSKKKQLYQEISKYLSADANNLIYEELFINKYTQSTSHNTASPKRRRRR